MPKTPDRFPGERDDEGIRLYDQGPEGIGGGDPDEKGVRYVTNRFKFHDAKGVFNPRAAYDSTSNPTVNDDDSAGFSVGCLWLNTSTSTVYILRDSTTGAAVWVNLTSGFDVDSILVDDSTLEVLVNDATKKILVNL